MNRRTLIRAMTAMAVGAVMAGGIVASQTTVQAAAVAPYLEAPMQPLTVGTWGHSAFPGMTRLADGSLRIVFREGPRHEATNPAEYGRIIMADSRDDGVTWVNPQVIREGGLDWRDPFISNPDGAERLTWFNASPSNSAMGANVLKIWGNDRRIDTLANAAISGPVVRLPDGRLATAYYGKQPGETRWSAWWAWSSDGGWTWTSNRLVNLLGAGVDTPEPYLVVSGSTIHVLYRWGIADGIGIRSSTDGGKTWSPQRKILDNASGRPTTIATASGTLVMVYRELPSQSAAMAYSIDNGQTWATAGVVLPAPAGSPHGMTYATMVTARDDPQKIRMVLGMEQADGSSDLWGGTVVLP